MSFAQIYTCTKCGDTWKPERVEIIDTERDDCWEELVCPICGNSVTAKTEDGVPVMHALTPEDIQQDLNYPEGLEESYGG